jgi:hypothetical protein
MSDSSPYSRDEQDKEDYGTAALFDNQDFQQPPVIPSDIVMIPQPRRLAATPSTLDISSNFLLDYENINKDLKINDKLSSIKSTIQQKGYRDTIVKHKLPAFLHTSRDKHSASSRV